ncbi:MAG: hypothetical protein PF574_03510 [Candidatus Delongbacteria bacterium]|jgi:hypothetical protein|nr:hypothetical protein [Candidatus Delongbacteria bacterium]
MKRILPLLLAITILFLGCGSGTEKTDSQKSIEKKLTKVEKIELTTERYCMIIKEKKKLLMETYWDQFKGKNYEEVKDVYAQYLKEEKAIEQKYGIVKWDALSSFFRTNFKEIEEYMANDPENIEYPERPDAKKTLINFAEYKYKEDMDDTKK